MNGFISGATANGVESALEAARQAIAGGGPLRKDQTNMAGWTAGVIEAYSLEAPAKLLYPVTTPWRNDFPRVAPEVMSSTLHWKKMTGINTSNAWGAVAYGARGTTVTKNEVDVSKTFVTRGLEDYVVREARKFAQSYQDLQALADLTLLQSVMVDEEDALIGANSTDIGAPAGTPTGTQSDTGGVLPDSTTYKVEVTALTLQGYRLATPASGVGESGVSTSSAGVATSGSGGGLHSIAWACADVKAAVAYNWYVQKTSGTYRYMGTTTVNRFTQTVDVAGTETAAPGATDNTGNANDYDGVLYSYTTGTGATAYYSSLNNSTITTNNAGGVAEFDTAFQTQFLSYGVGPDEIWVPAPIAKKITSLIIGSSAPVYRIDATAGDMTLKGGIRVGSVINQYTSEEVPIMTHRRFPPNLIIGLQKKTPYSYANLGRAMDVCVAEDYYREEFARTLRQLNFGVFHTSVLRIYNDFGGFVLKNVANS